jgi:hypothetical protein
MTRSRGRAAARARAARVAQPSASIMALHAGFEFLHCHLAQHHLRVVDATGEPRAQRGLPQLARLRSVPSAS